MQKKHTRSARFEFIYTPKRARWLNMIECAFSVISRQCLDRRIATVEQLRTEVLALRDEHEWIELARFRQVPILYKVVTDFVREHWVVEVDLRESWYRPITTSSMLGWVAAVIEMVSPSQLGPVVMHTT